MSNYIPGKTQVCNTHPIAWQQQKIMLTELKSRSDYVETEIHHNWDKATNTVSWFYSFNIENNSSWESIVKDVINKHQQPS